MIASKMPKCILVYNPHSGHGHLDSWNALFISFLLDAGWQVLALTPDATDLKNRLAQKKQLHIQHLQILDWNVPLRGLTERVIAKLSRVFRKLLGFNSISDSIVVSASDPELHYFEPIEFAKRIRIATNSVIHKPEIVFNMYMDMYRTDSERWRLFDQYNRFKWAGIRFFPREYPTEAYYQSPSFAGMCFLDEEVRTKYEKAEPNKSFTYLPDITETALPDYPAELVEHILNIANGRKIVFLGGSIGGNKNLAKWYELINLADPEIWFFVQIGEIHQSTLSKEDTVALDDILKNQPKNLFIKSEYLQSAAIFNAVIVASDVLFAVFSETGLLKPYSAFKSFI